MSGSFPPPFQYPLKSRRLCLANCHASALFHQRFHPPRGSQGAKGGVPILMADRELFLNMRMDRGRRSTESEAFEAFRPAHRKGDTENSANRLPNIVHFVD